MEDISELIVRAARGDKRAKEELRRLMSSGDIDVLAREFWSSARGMKIYSIDDRIRMEELKKAFIRLVSQVIQ